MDHEFIKLDTSLIATWNDAIPIASSRLISPVETQLFQAIMRGESRHAVDRSLFFANQGGFRTGDCEDIMNKASCLSLLSNAVLARNTVRMGEIAARLRAEGKTVSDEDLARISPFAYAHVIRDGTYVFDRA